ncbi:MAG: glycosyltransferase family 4 protein [Bdellovibrio sp.]|nr:glycosyltransferase family 4 protein [Bdellovibrio sp.]
MKSARVLHVIHSFSWGGLELYTSELIQQLQTTGLQQQVLCFGNSRIAKELEAAGVSVIGTPGSKISKLAEAQIIRACIKQYRITHLHSHTRLDMWACCLARWFDPNIKHIYNLYMNALPKRDFIHKALFKRVDALCSSSETIINDARKNFPIDQYKLRLIRYGRQTELFNHNRVERARIREKYNVHNDQMVIGTLCRIDDGKGVRELAESLDHLSDAELSKIQLWILGDPTAKGKAADGSPIYEEKSLELFTWLHGRCNSVRLKNHLKHIPFQKDYVSYLDAMDVFTLASYNETYSLSVLDAMMMEKPVIGTNAGGTPEQTGHNERGILAEPRSATSLAQCIRYYLQNPEVAQQHGHQAKDWAKSNHNWPNTLKQFLKLYS